MKVKQRNPCARVDKDRPWIDWLSTKIDKDHHIVEFELLALAVCTGAIDSTAFPKYHCFLSNQTGNTVLFAVTAFSLFGTRGTTDFMVPAPHLAVSLGFFCTGVFVAGQFANHFDAQNTRWWLLLSNIVQTAMVLLAALINLLFHTGEEILTAPVLCTIGLLAFSSGAQVAMSRQLSVPEIPTTQATAAYVDLFVDPRIFGSENRSRNRRVAFLIALIVGSCQ